MSKKVYCQVCDKFMPSIKDDCRIKHDVYDILKSRQTIIGLTKKEKEILTSVLNDIRKYVKEVND